MKLLSREEVVQAVDGGQGELFIKERWIVGERLVLVRKRVPQVESRGALVLVHGFAQNRYTWHTSTRSPANWWATKGWDVWNLELSGHGLSSAPEGPVDFSVYVSDLARAIEAISKEAGGAPVVMGHSLGGAVAYGAASKVEVEGVVGLAAIFHFARANPWMGWLCRLSNRFMLPVPGQARVKTKGVGQLMGRAYGLSDLMGYALPISGWWPGSIEEELLVERLERGFDWTNLTMWREMASWYRDGRFPYEDEWAASGVPVLVAVGDRDTMAGIGDARGAFDLSTSELSRLREFDHYNDEHHWGHLDIVLGREASRVVWPELNDWMVGVLDAKGR